MPDQTDDQRSRLQDYQERLEKLMATAREEVGRQAPEALEKLAAIARNIGQRLDEMASEARRTRAEQEATTPEPAPAPSGEPPPPPSGESGTAGA
jgi:DNA repair exonuclease SbcCD ATPase subunit